VRAQKAVCVLRASRSTPVQQCRADGDLTLGTADNIVDLFGGDGDASRQRVQDLRDTTPGGSALMEVAGGAVLPVGAAAAGAKGLAVGAATGGAIAGVGAAAEGQPVGPAAYAGALGGAGGAAVLAPALQFASRVAPRLTGSRGQRVAAELQTHTGISDDLNTTIHRAQQNRRRVSDEMYKPLEEQFERVDDPAVRNLLQQPDVAAHFKGPRTDGPASAFAPSFRQIQALRQRVTKLTRNPDLEKAENARDVLGSVNESLEGVAELGPRLKQADAAYALASKQADAIKLGRQTVSKSAADISRTMQELPAEAHDNFRRGMLHEIVRKLETREDGSVAMLNNFLDAGPETRSMLRQLFPDEIGYANFMRTVRYERSAVKIRQHLLKAGLFGAGAAGGTALGALMW
jgi:hypothetical protein